MSNQVEVLIQPITIRFSLYEDEISYHFAMGAEAQLDNMEKVMGVNPAESDFLSSNVGFMPVASVVLIKSQNENILVDPGNHHLGFYGMLDKALKQKGLTRGDIGTIIVTHWHHDHFSNLNMFPNAKLVIGENELEVGKAVYGEKEVQAKLEKVTSVIEIPNDNSKDQEIVPGVHTIYTPGHTPHSISVLVKEESGSTAIIGDLAMTKKDFLSETFSHWYTDEQEQLCKEGVQLIKKKDPSRIICGHDRIFSL